MSKPSPLIQLITEFLDALDAKRVPLNHVTVSEQLLCGLVVLLPTPMLADVQNGIIVLPLKS